MQQEVRQCQNCKEDFLIESEDFEFYENMQVPAPTFCPQCRLERRMIAYNAKSLYKRKCDKCNKDFECLVFGNEQPDCPSCNNKKVKKLMSASTFFSNQLRPFIPALLAADYTGSMETSGLPPEIQKAVIVYNGRLSHMPDFETLIANPQVRDYLGHLTQNLG